MINTIIILLILIVALLTICHCASQVRRCEDLIEALHDEINHEKRLQEHWKHLLNEERERNRL